MRSDTARRAARAIGGYPPQRSAGHFTVLIGGSRRVTTGMTAHGGTIVIGCPTVVKDSPWSPSSLPRPNGACTCM